MKNYNIKKLLNLPKQLRKVKLYESKHHGINALVVQAITHRYSKYTCPHCDTTHKHLSKGYKTVNIKYDIASIGLVILSVKKIRLTCSYCNKTFTPPIDNVSPNKSISNIINSRISNSIDTSVTAKNIAYNHFVSHSYASKIFNKTINSNVYDTNFNFLPESIGFDEFKSTKDDMSFIMVDHKTDEIIDILKTRRSDKLSMYFKKFPLKVRNSVKYITMDMYDPYVKIVKKFFKNAQIIFDKFHIMANFTKALNKVRINAMNQFDTKTPEYKKLKKHWRFVLKLNNSHWTYDYFNLSYFEKPIPLRDAVETMVKSNKDLKKSYDFLTVFHYHLNNEDFEAVDELIKSSIEYLPPQMKTAVKTFIKYREYCINAYTCKLTNARVESKIQKIKLIKRTAFGIPNFINLRNRIFYIQEITKMKKETNKAAFASQFITKTTCN